ncbi:MAG: hypothetical protein HY836_12875 [Aquabacterium sp.]|uniref:hypothetical protein n=1 Tax=Aquabacterium sp. TaxID=1872578 RepID=UPI0025C48D0C|nr:hypothetical protein [Aquabacterium sp.]MBI5926476.1 hypothetical protein [Aquabacterium sp.]
MTKPSAQEQQSSSAEAIQWTEEWLDREQILRLQALQVRAKLNPGAIRQYRDMTRAGKTPPPIKVAEVADKQGASRFYLLDGWHRWEADALVMECLGPTTLVRVLVAPMSMDDAIWVAAEANMGHGVQLKPAERRKVFGAYVKARKYWHVVKGTRKRQSYREMGAALGMNHNTLRNWMEKDFPNIFKAMSKDEGNEAPGGLMEVPAGPSPLDEVRDNLRRVVTLALSLPADERDTLARELHALLVDLPSPAPLVNVDEF